VIWEVLSCDDFCRMASTASRLTVAAYEYGSAIIQVGLYSLEAFPLCEKPS